MKKMKFKIKVILFLCIINLVSKIGFSQYFGGYGDGHLVGYINNTSCITNSLNPFIGGNSDGFSYSEKIFSDCATSVLNPFTGGNSSGYNFSSLVNTSCIIFGENPFVGGDSDGFSISYITNIICISNGINPYLGGSNAGFSIFEILNFSCSPITANPFAGGIGDGFFATPNSTSFFWQGDDLISPTDWSLSTNWSTDLVPDFSTNVTIPFLASGNFPIISSSENTKCLNINTNASLTVNQNSDLTVFGGLNCDGILNIKSPLNSGSSGSLIVEGSILGSGTANIQRYYTVNNRWQYTTVPFSNINSDRFTKNSMPYFNANFYKYNETFDLNPDPSGAIYSNWNLLSAAWQFAHNGSGGSALPLTKGTGYIYLDETNRIFTFSNVVTDISNSDLVFPLTYSPNDLNSNYFDGWNLIGNPYPSAIDWDAFAKNNIQNTVYYWDGNKKQYVYYNGTGGTQADDGSNVVNGDANSRYIPSLQAFFVKATQNGNFTIPLHAREHSNQNFWKKSDKIADIDISYLKLSLTDISTSDELSIRFFETATTDFDNDFDAYKVFNTLNSNIFSINNDISLAINSLPQFDTSMVIPVGFISQQKGNFEIKLKTNKMPSGTNIYLKDLKTNQVIDLNVETYRLDYQTAAETYNFELFFNKKITDEEFENVNIYTYGSTIYIQCPELAQAGNVYVFDIIGQLVLTDEITSTNSEISTYFSTGIYFVKTLINNKVTYKRVYLNRF